MRYTSIVFILSFAFLGTVSSMGIVHTVSLDAKLDKLNWEVYALKQGVESVSEKNKSESALAFDAGPIEISVISPADPKTVCVGDEVSISWYSTGVRDVGIVALGEKGDGTQIASVKVQQGQNSEFLWEAGKASSGEMLPDGKYTIVVHGTNGLEDFGSGAAIEPVEVTTCS